MDTTFDSKHLSHVSNWNVQLARELQSTNEKLKKLQKKMQQFERMQNEYEIAVSQNMLKETEIQRLNEENLALLFHLQLEREDRTSQEASIGSARSLENLSNSPPESDDSDTWRSAQHESTDSNESPTDEDLCSRPEETADTTEEISNDVSTGEQSHTSERKKLPVSWLEALSLNM